MDQAVLMEWVCGSGTGVEGAEVEEVQGCEARDLDVTMQEAGKGRQAVDGE